MPVLSVVIPRLKSNQLKWSFTGAFEVSDGLFPPSSVKRNHFGFCIFVFDAEWFYSIFHLPTF